MAKDYKECFTPIPKVQISLLNKTNLSVNFGLYFQRMVRWGRKENNEIETDIGFEKKRSDSKTDLCNKGNTLLPLAKSFLAKKRETQAEYLNFLAQQGIQTFSFKAKSTSPFITGLGSGHPTETGMILDRNIGVPYISASSIKGVLRLACALNLAEKNIEYRQKGAVPDNDETLVKYFGSMEQDEKNQKRGQLMFLDSYPEKTPTLKVDILNPHFSKYYSGENKQPVETETPVPVKFLAVKEGATFVFRCAFIPLQDETCNKEEIEAMFKTAFEKIGFGGKTSIGYGRFEKQ